MNQLTEREAYILLNMLAVNLSAARFSVLLQNCGSVKGIFEANRQDLLDIPGISSTFADKIIHWQDHADLERELEFIDRAGVTVITLPDPEYPDLLREIANPPLCLYIRGTLPLSLNQRSIAMVGTRNVSQYGAKMTRHLAESAAYNKWITVSGIAVGVDTLVHRATVDAGGITLAVLGGGLARFHPQENLNLAKEIIAGGGAVISEFPMNYVPTRYSFPQRNRIISGLTLGTLVVEAGLNSGSLITAACALEQNRHVFAVPGRADQENANGCNALIRKGATLVERFEHILEVFEFLPGFSFPASFREDSPQADYTTGKTSSVSLSTEKEDQDEFQALGLSDSDRAVMNALKSGSKSIDQLSSETGITASDLMASTIALELLNRIKRRPDGSFERVR